MIIYNVAQVFLNGWMVYEMIHAVLNKGHPFIGSRSIVGVAVESGASYAVWVHYCDKYLEFFDTYFMVLRGKMDQVRDYVIAASAYIVQLYGTALVFALSLSECC